MKIIYNKVQYELQYEESGVTITNGRHHCEVHITSRENLPELRCVEGHEYLRYYCTVLYCT